MTIQQAVMRHAIEKCDKPAGYVARKAINDGKCAAEEDALDILAYIHDLLADGKGFFSIWRDSSSIKYGYRGLDEHTLSFTFDHVQESEKDEYVVFFFRSYFLELEYSLGIKISKSPIYPTMVKLQ